MILDDSQIHDFTEIITTVFRLIDEEKYLELEQYETYELFNRQISSLNLLRKKNQTLHIDKVNCYPLVDYELSTIGGNRVFNTKIKVCFERYITDKNNNIVAGTKDYIIDVIYSVSFIENNPDQKIECKFCGAPIEKGASRCSFCGSLTNLKTKPWIICDLEEIGLVDPLKKSKEEYRKYLEERWNHIFKDNSNNYHL